MRAILIFLFMILPLPVFAGACTLASLNGKWLTVKSNAYYGTNSRCSITIASGTFSGTCYDRYRNGSAGGYTSGSYTASSGKITQVSSINSCLFTFTATMNGSIKVSGDFVLAQDIYSAHGYFFKDAYDYESGPFTAVKVP